MAHVFRGHASDIEQGHPDYERLHTHDDDTRLNAGAPLRDNRPRPPKNGTWHTPNADLVWRTTVNVDETQLPVGNRRMLYERDTITVKRTIATAPKPTKYQIRASHRPGKMITYPYVPPKS